MTGAMQVGAELMGTEATRVGAEIMVEEAEVTGMEATQVGAEIMAEGAEGATPVDIEHNLPHAAYHAIVSISSHGLTIRFPSFVYDTSLVRRKKNSSCVFVFNESSKHPSDRHFLYNSVDNKAQCVSCA